MTIGKRAYPLHDSNGLPLPYRAECKICHIVGYEFDNITNHLFQFHKDIKVDDYKDYVLETEPVWKCSYNGRLNNCTNKNNPCDKVWGNAKEVLQHEEENHPLKKCPVEGCSEKFRFNKHLQTHGKQKHGNSKLCFPEEEKEDKIQPPCVYICDYLKAGKSKRQVACRFRSRTAANMESHFERSHKDIKFKLEFMKKTKPTWLCFLQSYGCQQVFESEKAAKKHLDQVHPNKPCENCKNPVRQIKLLVKRHNARCKDFFTLQCILCENKNMTRIFRDDNAFSQHLKYHHKETASNLMSYVQVSKERKSQSNCFLLFNMNILT